MLKFWRRYAYIFLIIFLLLGLFDIRIAMLAIVCMMGPIILALLGRGRFWCGNICPRGNFYDNVLAKVSKKRNVPKLLKSRFFRTLVIIFMFSMFGLGIYINWGNISGIGLVFYRMIIGTTAVGVALSLFYNHRAWCSFCPMGTIAAVIAKTKKKNKTFKVMKKCESCRICAKKCPMGIVPYDYKGDILSHPDCIQCGKCVKYCPNDAIKY